MQTLSVEEAIQKPAPQVWEALTDWTNAHRWMPGIEGMTAEGETATGTKLTSAPVARIAQAPSSTVTSVDQ